MLYYFSLHDFVNRSTRNTIVFEDEAHLVRTRAKLKEVAATKQKIVHYSPYIHHLYCMLNQIEVLNALSLLDCWMSDNKQTRTQFDRAEFLIAV